MGAKLNTAVTPDTLIIIKNEILSIPTDGVGRTMGDTFFTQSASVFCYNGPSYQMFPKETPQDVRAKNRRVLFGQKEILW